MVDWKQTIPAEHRDFFDATDITGAEAETLTDGSIADSLHVHDTAGLSDNSVTNAKIAANSLPRILPSRRANYIGDVVYHNPYDDASALSALNCVLSNDTDNWRCASGATGRSVKVTPNAAGETVSWVRDTGLTLDLSDGEGGPGVYHGHMRVFIPEVTSGDSATSLIDAIRVYLFSTSTSSTYYRVYQQTAYGDHGWYDLSFVINDDNGVGGAWVDSDFGTINEIRIALRTNDPTKTPTISIDEVYIYRPLNTKAYVMFYLDGSLEDQREGCAYMQSKQLTSSNMKLRAMLATWQGRIDAVSRLTLDELKGIYEAGHQIGIYGIGLDDTSWQSMSQEDKTAAIIATQNYLANNGMPDGMRTMSCQGTANKIQEDWHTLFPRYCDCVIGGVPVSADRAVKATQDFMHMNGTVFCADGGTPNIATKLQNAIDTHSVLVYGAHLDAAGELTAFKSDIDDIVVEINAGNIIPITPEQLVSGEALTIESVKSREPTIKITAGTEAADARTITVQAFDAIGAAKAERFPMRVWSGTADYGAPSAAGNTYGNLTAGTLHEIITADADYRFISDANGKVVFDLTIAGAATRYIMAEIGGQIYSSGQLDWDA